MYFLSFRRELRKIVNAEAFLDPSDFIYYLFKSVLAAPAKAAPLKMIPLLRKTLRLRIRSS